MTFEQLDDIRGVNVTAVHSPSGAIAIYGSDGRWRTPWADIIPLDAHGPWTPIDEDIQFV